jgi:ABC-2 type transport system permease protein
MTEAVAPGVRTRPIALSWIAALKVLLVADTAVQMRNKRSLVLSLFLPLILLFALSAGKRANLLGDPRVLVAESITFGIVTLGVIGYSTAVARDREQGVFQRLRVTPAPTWTIMASRFVVQVVATLGIAVVVLVVGYVFKHVALDPVGYVLTLVIVVLGAALFLSIGQAIVGLIPSADTLNAMGRFILIPLIGLTVLGHTDVLGTTVEYISRWSPGGAFSVVLAAAMNPSVWNGETWGALGASLAYAAVFAGVGIRWFRWTAR